jgi:hypothetical protein
VEDVAISVVTTTCADPDYRGSVEASVQGCYAGDLQSKQPFNSDVLGQLEHCVEPFVLAQRFAVDFDSEC